MMFFVFFFLGRMLQLSASAVNLGGILDFLGSSGGSALVKVKGNS